MNKICVDSPTWTPGLSHPDIVKNATERRMVTFGKNDQRVLKMLEDQASALRPERWGNSLFASALCKLNEIGLIQSLGDGRYRLSPLGRTALAKLKTRPPASRINLKVEVNAL